MIGFIHSEGFVLPDTEIPDLPEILANARQIFDILSSWRKRKQVKYLVSKSKLTSAGEIRLNR